MKLSVSLISAAIAVFVLTGVARGGVVQADLTALAQSNTALVGISKAGDVKRSTDNGVSFATTRAATSSALINLNAFGSTVIAVGDAGFIARSADAGSTWTDLSAAAAPAFVGELRDVATKDGSFWVAVGKVNLNMTAVWSADAGATWTVGSVPAVHGTLRGVVYDANTTRWTAVGTDGTLGARILTSTDGKNWTSVTPPGGASPLNDVATDGQGRLLAIGDAGTLLTSVNGGLTFTADPNSGLLVSDNLTAVVYSATSGWTAGGQDLVQVNYTTGGGATLAQEPVPGGGDISALIVDGSGQVIVTGNSFAGYQTITFAGPGNQSLNASPVTLSSTATSGLTVTFAVVSGPATVSGNQLTLNGAGTVTVRASQAGNGSYNAAATVDRSFVVTNPVATVTLGNLTATYDGTAKNATATTVPAALPVTFTYNGSATAPTNAGSYAVVGTVASGGYTGSASGTLVVSPASQTITFTAPADQGFSTTPITLTATATSGLAVTFSVVSGPATVSGNTLTLTGTGSITVGAAQAGNANYGAAPATNRTFVISGNFASWQQANFTAGELSDVNVSGPNAVYGQDGLANLVKYALGLAPKTNTTNGTPQISTTATDWTYTYTRPTSVTDVTYTVEFSTNLTTWSSVGVTHQLVSSAGGTDIWQGSYPLSSAANVFFRLKVTY